MGGGSARSFPEKRSIQQPDLINLLHDAIITSDSGRIIRGWNAGAEEVYGWTAEEAIGQCSWTLLKTEAFLPQQEIDSVLRSLGRWDGELVHTRKDGKQITVESRQVLVLEPDGEAALLQVNRDITDRKRLEETLRANEERFRLLFDEGPLGAVISDADLVIQRANQAMCDMLGYTKQELEGRSILDLSHPDDVPASLDLRRRVRQGTQQKYELEKRYLTKAGETIWVRITAAGIRDRDGKLAHNIGLIENITERKRFEEALQASEEQFRLLFEEAPLGAAITDTGLTVLRANQALCRLLGYTKEELEGKCIADLSHPEDLAACLQIAKNVSEGPHSKYELEKRYVTKAGETIWVRLTAGAIRDRSGKVVHKLGLFENITERKRAEEALRQSEEHFRFLADSIPNLVWAALPDGSVVYNNARALEYMGTSQEGAQGDRWARYLHPDDVERVTETWQAAVAERRDYRSELRMRRASDGEYRWHLVRARPLQDENGRVIRWFGTATDIHDLRMAEAALRESEERYRLVAESVPEVIWMGLPDGGNAYCNRRWYEYTGFTEEQTYGSGWANALHPDDRDRVQREWAESARTGRNFDVEYRFRRVDGVYRWFRAHGSPIRDAQGRIVKWFGISVDIDDQKRHAEALRQTQKLESIGLLAGGIAHDFNNILAIIIGNASLVLPNLRGEDAEHLEAVIRAGEKGSELTRQLLAYAGRGRLTLEEVDVCAVMRSIEKLIRFSVPKKIDLRFSLEDGLPAVKADRSQIQQIAMNLVINAAEAIGSNKAGVIALKTSLRRIGPEDASAVRVIAGAGEKPEPGAYVCLEVSDSGSGIDPADRTRIFDPFFSTKFLGRGLGLSAVLGIVRAYGGFIEVESEPGKGSTFRINFPATSHRAAESATAIRKLKPVPKNTGTVLVVDDDAAVRRFVSDALKHYGYEVLQAADGKAALSLFYKHAERISAVFLDLVMPVLGGEEIIADLRRVRPDVKIIVTSGYDVERAERLVGKEGFALFLQKPYTAARLAEAVRKATG